MYMFPSAAPPNGKIHPLDDSDFLRGESDHRIANNLALIVGLVRLRARAVVQKPGPIARDEVRLLLDDIATRVEAVARLHRMLSRPSRQALVEVGDYLQEICASLTTSLSADGRVLLSYETAASCLLPPEQALSLGLLIIELMTNSVKYAHPTGVAGKIHIACRQTAGGGLVVNFSDDGVGLPENLDPMTDGGLGFRLVRSLAEQLGATVGFDHGPLGTRVRLEMRAAVRAEAAE
jgi:two-component sensor histidine kinase